MANPQLVDYVKEQMKAGVSEEGIRNTLRAAGWTDADVEDAVKSAKAPIGVATSAPGAAMAAKPAVSVVEDVRAAVTAHEAPADKEPTAIEVASTSATAKKLPILTIVFGVTTVIFLGVAAYLYNISNSSSQLSAQINDLTAQNGSMQTKVSDLTKKNTDLMNRVAALTASSTAWMSEIASLTDSNTLLTNELSLYVVNPILGTSPLPISLAGVVGRGGKNSYTLLLVNGVKITIQNSKDVKVDAALKSLVGSSTQIMGTHPAGSNSVAVTSVGGVSVQ